MLTESCERSNVVPHRWERFHRSACRRGHVRSRRNRSHHVPLLFGASRTCSACSSEQFRPWPAAPSPPWSSPPDPPRAYGGAPRRRPVAGRFPAVRQPCRSGPAVRARTVESESRHGLRATGGNLPPASRPAHSGVQRAAGARESTHMAPPAPPIKTPERPTRTLSPGPAGPASTTTPRTPRTPPDPVALPSPLRPGDRLADASGTTRRACPAPTAAAVNSPAPGPRRLRRPCRTSVRPDFHGPVREPCSDVHGKECRPAKENTGPLFADARRTTAAST